MLEGSFFSVAGAGAGVGSLLEGSLFPVAAAALVFSFPFPKKSFAVEGCGLGVSLGSDLGFVAGARALDVDGTGAAAEGGGGRRAVRRLTFLLTMVPYFGANSKGSSFAVRTCSSRVTSERTCRSCFFELGS
jgi:hypothetical protein